MRLYKLVALLAICLYSEFSLSKEISLRIDNEYFIEIHKDNKLIDKLDFFLDVKNKIKEGELASSNINISIYKENEHYVVNTDFFSSRYDEYFYIKNENNQLIIDKLITTSIAKEDFDVKTQSCSLILNELLEKYKYKVFDDTNGKCITYYALENSLSELETYISSLKKDDSHISDIDISRVNWYLKRFPLNSKTVMNYNNIAFYLNELDNSEPAIYLLNKIIESFPNRVVAYINLGDAYWEKENRKDAVQAYQKYVQKMQSLGKQEKIPERVLNRIKSFSNN